MLGLERWQFEMLLIIALGGSIVTILAGWLLWLALDTWRTVRSNAQRAPRTRHHHISRRHM
jgi:hypothetical protein